jgi:serine/threonine-protein kinase CTR1
LEYLHSLKPSIIHRDIKSLNVLQSYEGNYKICDFGLVKNTNTQAGTPAYMAPELFENKQYNKSVDVYSFGILLWEVITGEIPFYMIDVPDIRQRVLNGGRPRIPGGAISPRCSRLIQRCW